MLVESSQALLRCSPRLGESVFESDTTADTELRRQRRNCSPAAAAPGYDFNRNFQHRYI